MKEFEFRKTVLILRSEINVDVGNKHPEFFLLFRKTCIFTRPIRAILIPSFKNRIS